MIMSKKGQIPVEGNSSLVRDARSHGIINTNKTAYERAVKRATDAQEQRDEIRAASREINSLKSEMHEIKALLEILVSKE